MLANTYHLWLRPGRETLDAVGGMHRFMAWDGPILTDSGGFQVFSLESRRELDDDGVTFRSHLDGSAHRFTPENVVAFQEALGVDVAMALDECVKLPSPRAEIERAVERTTALGARAAPPRAGTPTARCCSASCRAGSTRTCARAAPPSWSRWTFPATRSAGSRSASRARRWIASRASPPRCCRRTSRAT